MTDPRWLDDREQRAWRGYLAMQGRLQAHLNRRLQADSGLSLADFEVLVALTDVPDGPASGCASSRRRCSGRRAVCRTTWPAWSGEG